MSYANGTPFLNLPQTVGSDHRDWFDTNEAFLALDTKIKTLWDGAASTADILEQLQETVSGLETDVSALQTVVDGHTTTLQAVNESLVLINSALTALNTDVHTKFDSAGIADPYDPTYGIYAVGDIVTYNGQRYKCVTAVAAAEPFDADKWLAEDIQTVLNQVNSDLAVKTAFTESTDDYVLTIDTTGKVGLIEMRFKRALTINPYARITTLAAAVIPFRTTLIGCPFNNLYISVDANGGIFNANISEIPANTLYHGTFLLAN